MVGEGLPVAGAERPRGGEEWMGGVAVIEGVIGGG